MMIAPLLLTEAWIPVGLSDTRLRAFYDGASVRDVGGHRQARIRIGSPTRIAGPIVLVYQDEDIDCAARTWSLVDYDARDENDRTVNRTAPGAPPRPPVPAVVGTMGDAIMTAVCAFAPMGTP